MSEVACRCQADVRNSYCTNLEHSNATVTQRAFERLKNPLELKIITKICRNDQQNNSLMHPLCFYKVLAGHTNCLLGSCGQLKVNRRCIYIHLKQPIEGGPIVPCFINRNRLGPPLLAYWMSYITDRRWVRKSMKHITYKRKILIRRNIYTNIQWIYET